MNTNATQPASADLMPREIASPTHTSATGPGESRVESNESSDSPPAVDLGHEPDRIQSQPAERHPANDHQNDHDHAPAADAHDTRDKPGNEATAGYGHGQAHSHPQSQTAGKLPPNKSELHSEDDPHVHHDAGASHLAAVAATISSIRESNAGLSQMLGEFATETRQAAAAHGDSLRAIHGAIHELRRAHQEIVSRLNQPQGQ